MSTTEAISPTSQVQIRPALASDADAVFSLLNELDVSYLPDGSPSSESGIGVKEGDDAQFMLRGQFQLAF